MAGVKRHPLLAAAGSWRVAKPPQACWRLAGAWVGADADFAGEAVERGEGERLGLSVGPVVGSGDVDGNDVMVAYSFAQEVSAKVDVFAGVEAGRVAGLGKRAFVVDVEDNGARDGHSC